MRIAAQRGDLHVFCFADGASDFMGVDIADGEVFPERRERSDTVERRQRAEQIRGGASGFVLEQRCLSDDGIFLSRTSLEVSCSDKRFAFKGTDDQFFLIPKLGPHMHDAFVSGRHGTHADDAGRRINGITWKTSIWKAHGEVGEVRDGLFADVVHAEGQTQVQQHERMDGTIGKTQVCRDAPAGVRRKGVLERCGKEGEHAFVDGDVPRVLVDRAGNEVVEVSAVADGVEHSIRRSWGG